MFSPKYTVTSKIIDYLTQIAEIRAVVERSALLPTREAFLRRAAVVKMAHSSTSIEGNSLSEYQVKELLDGKKPRAREEEIREVKNYLAALRLVDKIADRKSSFGVREVFSIHEVVVSGLIDEKKQGVFRPGPIYVVNVLPSGKEKIVYTPPGKSAVSSLVKEALRFLWAKKNVHSVIRAGLFHYQFETIHPFTDGNGRVGRLLTLLFLYQSGWSFRRSLVLEDFYNRDRKRYYLKLQTGRDYSSRQGIDLTVWLEYFMEGFLDEAAKVSEQVTMLAAAGKKGLPRILDTHELKIVDFVVTLGKIGSSDAVDILRIPKRTAQGKLARLVDKGVLVKIGRGPATIYQLAAGQA